MPNKPQRPPPKLKKLEEEDNMFKKYFDKEDKQKLAFIQGEISRYSLVIEGLRQLMTSFVQSKFSKYGLDASKNWTINPETGQISEVKPQKDNAKGNLST